MKKSISALVLVIAAAFGLPQLANAQADVSEGCTLIVRALKQGDRGAEVLALETFLKDAKYFKGTPNQVFDRRTKQAVIAFQLAEGIFKREDAVNAGVLTAATRDAIAEKTCKKRELTGAGSCIFLTRGLSVSNNVQAARQEIRELQRLLVQKNYMNQTDITGFFGPVTRQALTQFQLDNGIIASRTSDGAGIAGPRTREFIQNSTCGSAEITTTASSAIESYAATVAVRKNLVVDDITGETVITLTITPKEKNAALASVRLRVETDDDELLPARYIDYIDVYHQGIISRNRAAASNWTKVNDTTYDIVLDGDQTALDARTENAFTIRVVPTRSMLNAERASFTASIPANGARIQFDKVTGANAGVQAWGSPDTEATFTIGGRVAATNTTTTTTTGGTDTTDTTNTTNTAAPAAVKAPVLQSIKPVSGRFGTVLTLMGKNFESTGNHIEIRHPKTNASLTLRNFQARGERILVTFPGKNREFIRPNGTKVSGELGNYQIRVISNNKRSNAEVFKVTQ